MRNVKRFSLFFCLILLTSVLISPFTVCFAYEPSFQVWSEAGYLVNLDTNDVIWSKNPDKKMYPASVTKIMTAIIVLENITDINKKVEVPYDCFDEFSSGDPNKEGASTAAIEPLQTNVTYKDCLYGLMLASGCEAANILAYNICDGDMNAFYAKMTKKAKSLGCKGTNFSNAHGLYEDENYTTAYDMYLISRYAYDNVPRFMDICDTYEYQMPKNTAYPEGYSIYSTNSLLKPTSIYQYEYAHGMKTGTLDQGGRCLVSTAKNQYTYLLVTLGAPIYDSKGEMYDEYYSFVDATKLYDWAFNSFSVQEVLSKTEKIMEVQVNLGENADHVTLVPAEDFSSLLPSNLDKTAIQYVKPTIPTVNAPVEKGTVMGQLTLKLSGEELLTVDLITADGVTRSDFEYYKQKISQEINKTWFKACIVVLGVLIFLFVVFKTIENTVRRRQQAKKSSNKGRRY